MTCLTVLALMALAVGAQADFSVFGLGGAGGGVRNPFQTRLTSPFVRPGVGAGSFRPAVRTPVQGPVQGPVQAQVQPAAQPAATPSTRGFPSPVNEAGRRFLALPNPQLCAARTINAKFGNHGYYFSWLDPSAGSLTYDWLDYRSWCRLRCMDAVSIETPEENEFIKQKLRDAFQKGAAQFTWTSGRLCDFKGCEADYLQPIRVNGWFWSGSGARIAAKGQGFTDWAQVGGIPGQPQPDNREGEESCIALLNPDIYKDPTRDFHWHDVACHHQKPVVCEDSDELLGYARQENPQLAIP